jgi:hypothetical protein
MKRDRLQHSIYKILLIGCALLCALYSTSCVSQPKYPSQWPALIPIEDESCPDISGTYDIKDEGTPRRNVPQDPNRKTFSAETTSDTVTHLYLYEVVPMKFFFTRGRIAYATHAEIVQPDDDTLEIYFFDDKGLIDKKIYSLQKKEYACSWAGIIFPFCQGGGSSIGSVGVSGCGKYILARSIDGSLIIREEGIASGVFLYIPFGGVYNIWHRFKVYEK